MSKIREILNKLLSDWADGKVDNADQAEAEIEAEFQRRLGKKMDEEKVTKCIYEFLERCYGKILTEDLAVGFIQAIAKEIGGER